MEFAQLVVSVVTLALVGWTLAQARRGGGLTRRMRRRDEYASRSCAYAEKIGHKGDKLEHALACFRALDESDNGRRDYSDKEARLAIEAHLGSKPKGTP